ncbi:hypothetical protein AMTR_s00060p00195560 [Amborella trichopoda]|uniref:Uncharacterized protein n=1 Tax=Amborella trichopoda TaxID=13333 RepID=W1NJI3_AMBTC|nr:hypothetical protein AMTR_s00060p00195560 [Amborella trichopoda]
MGIYVNPLPNNDPQFGAQSVVADDAKGEASILEIQKETPMRGPSLLIFPSKELVILKSRVPRGVTSWESLVQHQNQKRLLNKEPDEEIKSPIVGVDVINLQEGPPQKGQHFAREVRDLNIDGPTNHASTSSYGTNPSTSCEPSKTIYPTGPRGENH